MLNMLRATAQNFAAVCNLGLEGIVSKRLTSNYIGAVEILDQGREPEGSCCKPRP